MTDETRRALESIGMDIEQTLTRFVGNEGLLMRFVKRFPEDESYQKLAEAMANRDAQDAFHQAHTLKGVVGNLGFGRLFDAVGPMVELLRQDRMDEADGFFPELRDAYDATVQVIGALEA